MQALPEVDTDIDGMINNPSSQNILNEYVSMRERFRIDICGLTSMHFSFICVLASIKLIQ